VKKPTFPNISNSRRLLGNPYAYLEYLEESYLEFLSESNPASADQIATARRLLAHPYAYLDGDGSYSALSAPRITQKVIPTCPDTRRAGQVLGRPAGVRARQRSDDEIELRVREVQSLLWRNGRALQQGKLPSDPIEVLDPGTALKEFGYELSVEAGLGNYRSPGGLVEVAGLIDRTAKTVRISGQFPLPTQLFTAAHELGHAVLHPEAGGIHRDRPKDGAETSRANHEIEADKFATFFLMPSKLVRAYFGQRFNTEIFVLNDETAYALLGQTLEKARAGNPTRRDVARLLAAAERYDGRSFISLATRFRVSVGAMAIRIEELGLLG
jgi:Zn-dependent peptidase ImmA (M78 family)